MIQINTYIPIIINLSKSVQTDLIAIYLLPSKLEKCIKNIDFNISEFKNQLRMMNLILYYQNTLENHIQHVQILFLNLKKLLLLQILMIKINIYLVIIKHNMIKM